MAKTGEHARDFLTRLRDRSQPFFACENQELISFVQSYAKAMPAGVPTTLQPWDIPYWAEVLDADAFSRFNEEGIFHIETGMAFRNEILARGDSEDPNLLIREFLGREPNEEAIFARAGLSDP